MVLWHFGLAQEQSTYQLVKGHGFNPWHVHFKNTKHNYYPIAQRGK